MVARRVIEIEEQEVDPETGWPLPKSRLASAVIIGDVDENGGFWVGFTHADILLTGKIAREPRGRWVGVSPLAPLSEWYEWFQM
jgi:hypothetical protein